MTDIALNDQQCKAILTEAISKKMFGGTISADPAARLKDATDLLRAVEAASKNGNKSENVNAILFIAKTDLDPIVEEPIAPNPAVVADAYKTVGEDIGREIAQKELSPDNLYNGLNLSELSDGVLDGLIVGLEKYSDTEQVQQDRAAYTAEKERRLNARPQEIQEIPQTEAQGEAEEIPSEPAGGGAEGEIQLEDGGPSGESSETAEDAGAFARVQTPETSKEGKSNESESDAENGERPEVEEQLLKLGYDAIKAHGIDITKLDKIPVRKLKKIIENPEGPPKMPINEQEIEQNAIPSERSGGMAVGGVSVGESAPEQVISKADLGIDLGKAEEEPRGGISAEREKVESLITGPILKAYGRGRKQIPDMGINELRFMVLNPDGRVSPQELAAAKYKDNPTSADSAAEPGTLAEVQVKQEAFLAGDSQQEIAQKEIEKEPIPDTPQPDPNRPRFEGDGIPVEKPIQVEEEPDRTVVEAAQQAVAQKESEVVIKSPPDVNSVEDIAAQNAPREESIVLPDKKKSRAMEIINRERMPISPELEGEPPVLPLDVSAISRDELFSLHAKFHACESRMNWITSEFEDEVNDYIKLRTNREAEVAANVPFMGEDGKRNTNEFRDAKVKADSKVLEYGNKEHELNKDLKKLKVLQKNYHMDCERLSRQMSKYERERLDGPRG